MKNAGTATEVKFPGKNLQSSKPSNVLKRRVLFNGALAVAALIIVVIIWLQTTADSVNPGANPHKAVSLFPPDSLRSDSAITLIANTDSSENDGPSGPIAEEVHKQTENQPLNVPAGAVTVIEVNRGIAQDYEPLGETGPDGEYYYHFPGEPDTYVYRLKFVLGDQESVYTRTNLLIIEDPQRIYLPLVVR